MGHRPIYFMGGKMKLLFKTDGIIDGKVEFESGKIYEISDELGSATRWINRGAEVVEADEVEKTIKEEIQEIKEELLEIKEEIANEEPKEDNKKGKSKIKGL